ncbi:MAG: MotA/TolQ/ExbB proton channel family protein [Vicinamibacteria bacterium]
MERQKDVRGTSRCPKIAPKLIGPNRLWHPQDPAQLVRGILDPRDPGPGPLPDVGGVPGRSRGPAIANAGGVARSVLPVLLLLPGFLGDHPLQGNLPPPGPRAVDDLPRDLPQEQQVLRGEPICPQPRASPLVGVLQAGCYPRGEPAGPRRPDEGGRRGEPAHGPQPESLSRSLARAGGVEVTRMERRISFLATTASVTPFIGLFGTVWGIMTAFGDIGRMQSTNIAVVAPGT